jgi:hypothetical protein
MYGCAKAMDQANENIVLTFDLCLDHGLYPSSRFLPSFFVRRLS